MAATSRPRTSRIPFERRFVLEGVRWRTYESLLKDLEHSNVRLTYDRGRLEFMAPALIHEANKRGLGRLIETMTEALNIPIRSGGSTTFRQKLKKRGLEPDECYWLEHEPAIRGKTELDLDLDPLPDLAIEVENTKSAVDKLAVYAALGFPEVWRYNGESIQVFRLQADGTYLRLDQSPQFPFLALADLVRFLRLLDTTDETTWIRGFRAWVLETLALLHPDSDAGV